MCVITVFKNVPTLLSKIFFLFPLLAKIIANYSLQFVDKEQLRLFCDFIRGFYLIVHLKEKLFIKLNNGLKKV